MKEKKKKLSIKKFLLIVSWTFKMYFRISPVMTILLIVSRTVLSLINLLYAGLFAKGIDLAIKIAESPEKDISKILQFLLAVFVFNVLVQIFFGGINNYTSRGLRALSYPKLQMMMAKHLNALGIQSLENPEIANKVQRAEQWLYDTFTLLTESVKFIAFFVRMIVSGAVIISFFPLMIPILIILIAIKYFPNAHFMKKDFRWQVDNTEGRRKAGFTIYQLETPISLQEISIVGGFGYLSRLFTKFYDWYNKGFIKIIRDREITAFFLDILDVLVSLTGYAIIFANFIAGKISVGTITFQIRALDTFSGSLQDMLESILYMNEFAVKMDDVVSLFEIDSGVPDGKHKLPRLDTPPTIEFRNVSFKYPKADSYIFKNLSFKINSGEEIALVGHNGAGKTTIVKLLSRIYQVTEGEILINGININDLAINDWYKNLGVLFQEFNFYSHLTVRENIFMGKSTKKVDEEKIVEAAKNADAHEFIMEYKNGYNQIMNEKFEGGIRPSFGQMQKIAIARFFYRNAPLAIFDEPTAAIDAVSEYNIFNRIYEFFTNKTVIIISHRFSTVRNASRIFVLEKGKIVEEGNHKELIEKHGVYEKAYKLQAEGYQN